MDYQKINGLIRAIIATIGGGTITVFIERASAMGVEVPDAEGIIGVIAGVLLVSGAAIWSWMSKGKKKG